MPNVIVTNKGKEPFSKRFDSVEYVFPVGEEVTIDEEAAIFLFGYARDEAEKLRTLVRNGWLRVSDPASPAGPQAARDRLSSFIFSKAPDLHTPKKEAPVYDPEKGPTVAQALSTHATTQLEPRATNKPGASRTIHLPGRKEALAPRTDVA